MRLLISAFGLGQELFHQYFHYMPPVSMARIGPRFVPDYPVLLLFDEYVVNANSLERMREFRHMFYQEMGLALEALESSGRLIVEDFDGHVRKHLDQILEAVEYDLRNLGEWGSVIKEANVRWQEFCEIGRRLLADRAPASMSREELDLLSIFEHGFYYDGHGIRHAALSRSLSELVAQWKSKMEPEAICSRIW